MPEKKRKSRRIKVWMSGKGIQPKKRFCITNVIFIAVIFGFWIISSTVSLTALIVLFSEYIAVPNNTGSVLFFLNVFVLNLLVYWIVSSALFYYMLNILRHNFFFLTKKVDHLKEGTILKLQSTVFLYLILNALWIPIMFTTFQEEAVRAINEANAISGSTSQFGISLARSFSYVFLSFHVVDVLLALGLLINNIFEKTDISISETLSQKESKI